MSFVNALVLFACFVPMAAFSQTVIMPVTGQADTTMAYAELYDDGGPSGPYSTTCNATYTFHTVNSAGRYRIDVQSQLTHDIGNARLRIYNGSTASGAPIESFPYVMNGTYYSLGNSVTVSFIADDDSPTQGFQVILCEFDNPVASSVYTTFIDSTSIHLAWNESSSNITWYLNWAIVCDDNVDIATFFSNPANYNSDTLDNNSFYVYDVPVGCRLIYYIYANPVSSCSPTVSGISDIYHRPVECPCIFPTSYTVTELADSVIISWTSDTLVDNWYLWASDNSFDTVLPGNVYQITIPYDYPCYGKTIFINDSCYPACSYSMITLPFGGCRETVGMLSRTGVTATSISFSWHDVQDSAAQYVLMIRCLDGLAPVFDSIIDTLPFGTTQYTAYNLHKHTNYYFTVRVICGDGSPGCYSSTASFYTTMDNCIDFIDLRYNNAIHFTYGSYNNPTQSQNLNSYRHVAILDSSLRDAQTANQLRCVPPDEEVSFRLGDPGIGANAETVTYDYLVDSLDKDMLVLKYAVVMQNPNHTSENQPHFTMEILDVFGQILDTTCCYADFYAAGDIGFNTVPGTNVIWKDWTTVGIDIAKYHGQLIKIRFTTKDCADGGHFGYAYFTIHCDSKRIALVNLCESLDSVRLRVPLGFDYQWTRDGDTTIISTENEIIVPADSNIYRCYATFIGNPECSFTVSSRAILPFPKAAFDYDIDTCGQEIRLYNRSYIDIDSAYLQYVRQTIDDIIWIINGDTILGDTITFDAHTDTTYDIALFCRLSESFCTDSTFLQINPVIAHNLTIGGDTSACVGDTVQLATHFYPHNEVIFHWNNLSTDTTLDFVAIRDTAFYIVYNYKSCTDTVLHQIAVYQHNNDTIYSDNCTGWHDTLGFDASQTGIYTLYLTNRHGCDSLSSLNLIVHPSYYDTVIAATCDESFVNSEFNEDSTGVYTHFYTTIFGCDSIYALDFKRYKIFDDTIDAEILYGDTYNNLDFFENATGTYQNINADVNGCDSILTLNLHVIYLQFPNAVTPNGDGYSDVLEIVGLLDATIFDTPRIHVYDRWGRLIYKCDNIKSQSDFWDPNKTNSPDGTYFYRFTVSTINHQIQHNSPVEVVRSH